MRVDYEVNKTDEGLFVRLFTIPSNNDSLYIVENQSITRKDFLKAGNLIDRQTLPGKFCVVLLRGFQEKVIREILKASELVDDQKLRDSMVSYTKRIMNDEVDIVSEEVFMNMVKEVEEYSESLKH